MEGIDEAMQLEKEMIKAMERKEFCLFYQPKVDLVSGKMMGVEALVRWIRPEKGIIPPIKFIPAAEESGFIIPLGEWILRTACFQMKDWLNIENKPQYMSVNLSARQIYQPDFVNQVKHILIETNLAPEYLVLEITEGIMLDTFHAPKVIRELKNLGVRISLDDFGTGFNSMQYLQELPFDNIKIDQSFVRNCDTDLNNGTIVKSIIEMAHQLKMDVVAEGIETEGQLIFLQQNLCNIGQGYLFSKPLHPDELMHDFRSIEKVVNHKGIPHEVTRQKLNIEMLGNAHQDLIDTIRLQQGMIFKFKKIAGKFIHTLCDGKLLSQVKLTPEHVVGKELSDFLSPEDVENKISYYHRAWNGEENVTFEGELFGIHYLASLSPIRRGGEVTEVIGSCIDISEQKRIEEALRLKESQYRIITENTQDLIRVIDQNFKLEYASPSHEFVLGAPPEAYEGQLIFDMMHPDDCDRIKKLYTVAALTKTPVQTEFRLKHTDGGWVEFEDRANPVLDADNRLKHLVIVARDISERKKAEEFIRKADKLSVIGPLATSIAHEIRNPLTTIKGFVQLLQNEVEKPFYINTMLNEIDRIEEFISEFLSFNHQPINQMKKSDLSDLFQQVLMIIQPRLTMYNIKMEQEFEFNLPQLYCDEGQIKRVFLQILQNAIEAMPNGGRIQVKIARKGINHLKISFIDQGMGITEERIRKIGEPFYSTKEKGTGLGLMISHKVIKEHGGWIDIHSVVNNGTTVDIFLPINQEMV
ncbi:EAL domain-containing protein [Neobacillus mesonae]|uniref:EAL domain-containing protein n=1 Tax=Neobacillus mesonae TaxID=1193713 RepID=UPI0020402A2E|nr:EAL domain-containing protein [Neobacillus mesonae]MCM3570451.1 EAL domain-containing protein [Neobacillus mesonae]